VQLLSATVFASVRKIIDYTTYAWRGGYKSSEHKHENMPLLRKKFFKTAYDLT